MTKKESLPKPITILILTLLTALVWVGLSVYRAFSVKPGPTVPEEVLRPIKPILNTDVIGKIQSSLFFSDSEIPQISAVGSNTPAPIPTLTPAPINTPEATSSPTPAP